MRLGKQATMTAVTAPTQGPARRRPSTPASAIEAVESRMFNPTAAASQWSGNGECCISQNQAARIAGYPMG